MFGLGPRTTHIRRDQLAGLQLARTAYGMPIPIVYGTMRMPGSLIDYDLFRAVPVQSKQRTGKSTVVTTDYTYFVFAIYALCEGEIDGVGIIWADKDRGTFADSHFASAIGNLALGSVTQSVWSLLNSLLPAKALNYSGTAYIGAFEIPLEGDGQLQNYTFEVQGLFRGMVTGAGDDAFPPEMIFDFLTNTRYGAGWDPALIADFGLGQDGLAASSYERYCQASGFFLSAALTSQRPATEWLKEWLVATNSGAIFSDGVLKIFPFGDVPVTGNSVTFTPYTTARYALGPDEILPSTRGGPLFTVQRRPLSDSFNVIPVEYLPRETVSTTADYNPSVIQDPEPVDAERYGIRQGANLTLHCITRPEHALQLSRIAAQRSVYVRNVYTFVLPYRYILLDPMDLVTLTDPVRGIADQYVRILTQEETPDGRLLFTAEEWPFGVGTGVQYDTEQNDGANPNNLVSGGNTTAPQMFDIPLDIAADDEIDVGIVASGGDNWGGCEVWLSFDNVTYQKVGVISKKGSYGELTSALAAGSGFDVTNTCDVDLGVSGGSLEDTSDQSAQEGLNLSWLDDEFVSFADATLTAPNEYELARIQRGIYGTTGALHAIGAKFARMDAAMFRLMLPAGRLGDTIYIKLPSFNIYGTALQELSAATAYTHVPTHVFANPGGGPTLYAEVEDATPTAAQATITYTAVGTLEAGVSKITFDSVPASPWVVDKPAYGAAALTYWLRATRNKQTILVPLVVAPVPFVETGTPTIYDLRVGTIFSPGDGGGSVTVSWSAANMPGGVAYSVDVVVDSGDPISSGSQTVDPATSPQVVTGSIALGTNAIITVTVTAYTTGPVTVASATLTQQVS